MKTFTIDIAPQLKDVTFTVNNGAEFERCLIKGNYRTFQIKVCDTDIQRVRQYAVKHGNDNNSNRGRWYAHCNGYSMDLIVNYSNFVQINTYRPYGKA